MRDFVELYQQLDRTNSTRVKIKALRQYFRNAEPADAAWSVAVLAGQRQKRLIGPSLLRQWLTELSGLPEWLVEQSYAHVGDLAETVALLLSNQACRESFNGAGLASIMTEIVGLRTADSQQKENWVKVRWQTSCKEECFVLTKLITGALRVGVSKTSVAKALAAEFNLEAGLLQRRLMGDWQPNADNFSKLIAVDDGQFQLSQPYPFYLASALGAVPETLGDARDWMVEWKWDGIRAQLIKRAGQVFLWSRGEELIMEAFPEIVRAGEQLPDGCVIDGEILAWQSPPSSDTDGSGQPMNFNDLQRRLGRKKVGKKLASEVPVRLLAFDLLEFNSIDMRQQSIQYRRELLQSLVASVNHRNINLSPQHQGTWQQFAELRGSSRQYSVEGLMLKRKDSRYQVGRVKGDWWKWKVEPYQIDAVMIYAQAGHGRRSNLYTDYTFAVWQQDTLIPVAKAYSGLTDSEIKELDKWIRKHTLERFGPVRSVQPAQVFQLAFEGIAASSRHKSGVAVRFPRIVRWRKDKLAKQADSLQQIMSYLSAQQV